MPIEPTPTGWVFPPVEEADENGLVGVGADLEPGTILAAYKVGLFPMPVRGGHLGWWSPDPRAIIPLDGLRVSKSLRRSCREYEVRVDTAFDAVVDGCATTERPHGWITDDVRAAYSRLHEMGWGHSIEAWRGDELVGGLYGVGVNGLFAGESMFSRARDASKVALVALVHHMTEDGVAGRVLDTQWLTPHLASLGAVEVPRARYLELVAAALDVPAPPAFS